MNQEHRIIKTGLDFPDVFGFWEINEIIVASTFFMLFILIQEIFLGGFVCASVLYLSHRMKDHSIRGKQTHLLWKLGFITGQGFEYFPPPAVTYFCE